MSGYASEEFQVAYRHDHVFLSAFVANFAKP